MLTFTCIGGVMSEELKSYLENTIIPLFTSLLRNGVVEYDVIGERLLPSNENTTVQLGRYLWFFSAYYNKYNDIDIMRICDDLYINLIDNYQIDGGFIISNKNNNFHVYHNSFVLYGLAEYYQASKNSEVLKQIEKLHLFIEHNFFQKDIGVYHEQLDDKLNKVSKNCIDYRIGGYTANSLIHLLEAYTNVVYHTGLYNQTLARLLDILFENFYSVEGYFFPYLTSEFEPDDSAVSYGHDIETIWLIIEAIEALDYKLEDYTQRLTSVYNTVVSEGLQEDGFIKVQSDKQIACWWGQVEAIVGFTYCDKKLALKNDYATLVYQFTKDHFMSDDGVYNEVSWDREVINKDVANIWKTPYHDGRMMLKIIALNEKENNEFR